jgi:hypothetical protein
MPHAIGTHFERSRKRAIATGSRPAWQGPESGFRAVIYGVIPGRAAARSSDVQLQIGKSRPITSGFRVRSLCERPGMTEGRPGFTPAPARCGC